MARSNHERDNSFGRGYYEPPNRLLGLGRFVENLRPKNLVNIRVFPDEGIWMLTAEADGRLSIMRRDLESLLSQGLIRIQSNEAGTLDFYFQDEPIR